MTPEGKIKAQIKAMLTHNKAWYFLPVSGGYGTHGIMDFVGCYKGLFFGIEAKAPGKKPTALQLMQKAKIEAAGGHWFLVDGPESLFQVQQFFDNNE